MRGMLGALVAVASIALGASGCGGPKVESFGAPKAPVTEISNADYQTLLGKYVGGDGKVDYARWKENASDVRALDDYLARAASAPPETRPELFHSQTEKLSYWINLYNALVLREVLRRWPIESVVAIQVTPAGTLKNGRAFFYELHVDVGGQPMNLYDIENKIIRAQFRDARVHFAINCSSTSCPLLRNDAYEPKELDRQLDTASKAFVNDGKDVAVDDAKKEVVMSKIFQWFQGDFVAYTKARSNVKEAGVVDFALLYAADPLSAKLKEAKSKSYKVVFLDYDWAVNKNAGAAPAMSPSTPPPPPPPSEEEPKKTP